MRRNFVCPYCNKVHAMDSVSCSETGRIISPAHKMLLTSVDGRYAVSSFIGEGGMGVIYRAEDLRERRTVIVKVLNPAASQSKDAYERFRREAMAAVTIRHQNIARVFDIGTTVSGVPYIVMEHLSGQDLGGRIAETCSFPLEGAKLVLSQILQTLEAVHAEGIVHRDLKPENIFLVTHKDLSEYVKLLDFGIARLTTGEYRGPRITATGRIFGTPLYISPEQATGELDIDHRSDLFSAGVIFYEMLTGRLPFFARSPSRVLVNIMTRPAHDPRGHVPDLPEAAAEFFSVALAKKPDERFQSARMMLDELEALDIGAPGRVSAPPGRIKQKAEAGEEPTGTPADGLPASIARIMQLPSRAGEEPIDGDTPPDGISAELARDMKTPYQPPPAPEIKKEPRHGSYRFITPYERSSSKEEDGQPAKEPPLPPIDEPAMSAAAARVKQARTVPEPADSKGSVLTPQTPITTPTPDRDDENER